MERHRIDKAALRETITSLEGLTNEQKAELLQLLSEQKRYGLVWEDHTEEVEEQLRTKLPVLSEVKDKMIPSPSPSERGETSSHFGGVNHVLIEGDNLHALTALTYTHEGRVDVIYIDPPYNTGNKDFVYNDTFVDKDDSFRHSKWLSFMHKRLKIAKRLLSDRGVIFISIDDNEQANLKLLCDEVFGERNFIMQITWRRTDNQSNIGKVAKVAEYILLYSKDVKNCVIGRLPLSEKAKSEYQYEDERGRYGRGQLRDAVRGKHNYDIITPNGFICKGPWFLPKEEFDKLVKKDLIHWPEKKGGTPRRKIYLSDMLDKGQIPNNFWGIEFGTNQRGSLEVESILGRRLFDYPKPKSLIQNLINLGCSKTSLILDFFAGSGTTLHATMQLNAEDGGHRQCILVTNNENGICENVTYERNRRVIEGYTTPKGVDVPGLSGNNLRYYRTDFVERETTRTAKRQLMMASTELLCIKHDVYDEQRSFGSITLRPTIARYFTGGKQQMLIIYRTEAIESLVAEIAQMPESTRILVYVFSTNNYAMDADFEEVSDKVTLCALPAAIYNAYLRVLPKRSFAKDDALRYDDDALRYDDPSTSSGQAHKNDGGTEA